MNFFSKLILYSTHDYLIAGVCRFGRIRRVEKFSSNEAGVVRFEAFIKQFPNTHSYLLVDVVEEDYRQEILPHVTGRDRRSLLARKLDQLYHKLSFRTAVFLSQDKENHRRDRFLFLAINQSEHIDAWLEIIGKQQAPLAGVYLLPMLTGFLLKKGQFSGPKILLCECLNSGLRQSYLEEGKLLVSRLSPYPVSTSLQQNNILRDFYLSEIERSRFYLVSQRLIKPTDQLLLVLNSTCADAEILISDNMDARVLSFDHFQKLLRVDVSDLKNNPELLYLHLFAKRGAKNLGNLAPKGLLKNYYLNQIRRHANLATLAVCLAAIFSSLMFLFEEQARQQAIKKLINATNLQKIKYEQVAKDFPHTPYPSDQLLRVVNFYSEISQYQRTPEQMMRVISQSINKVPDIQINKIDWLQTPDVNAFDTEEHGQKEAINNTPAAHPFSKNQLHQMAYVSCEIKRFNGDYRGALQQASQMVDNLKKDVNVAYVELFQAPVNVSSYSNLEGSTTDEIDNKPMSALFKIKLVLKQFEVKK